MLLRFLAQISRSADAKAAARKADARRGAGRRQRRLRLTRFDRDAALAFESLEGRALLATFSNVHLVADTGASNTDRITYDPTISGTVSATGFGSVRVDFDHDDDGVAEASLTLPTSFSMFNYNPLAVDPSLDDFSGTFVINYRAVELWSGGSAGPWTSFAMTLDRVAPTVVSFSPAADEVALHTLEAATVTLSEPLQPIQSGDAYVLSDVDHLPPPQTVSQPSSSTIEVSFTSPLASNDHTTTVNGVRDIAGNVLNPFASATWHVNIPPIIYLSTYARVGQSVYRLSGYVTDADGPVDDLTVTIGGIASASTQTDSEGYFEKLVEINSSGVVEATTVDVAGAPSNVATQIIYNH